MSLANTLSPPPPSVAPIERALQQIHETINRLESLLSDNRARLQPVLGEAVPVCAPESTESTCPLHESLAVINTRLRGLAIELDAVNERIQL